MSDLISERPEILHSNPFYKSLPLANLEFNYRSLPYFLNADILQFFGIMPKTIDLFENVQRNFTEVPSDKEVEYYKRNNTQFQIINVVANVHTIQQKANNSYLAFPYSISLIPFQKRGLPDTCHIDFIKRFSGFKHEENKKVYTQYSPFKPLEQGFYGPLEFFIQSNTHYTDTVGFILESFFLPTNISLNDALISSPQFSNSSRWEKYRKHRVKKYFTPFQNVRPRKIWGCDSPIELFLIQGLAQKGFFPKIQTVIFRDGEIYDNFYQMMHDHIFKSGADIITEVDLYFPDQNLAVFCDSGKYHRGFKNNKKDELIDGALISFGIKSLRIKGRDIVRNLENCVDLIIDKLL